MKKFIAFVFAAVLTAGVFGTGVTTLGSQEDQIYSFGSDDTSRGLRLVTNDMRYASKGVAMIGETTYRTLKAAIQGAGEMSGFPVITLIGDINVSETLELEGDFALNFNGHKIIGSADLGDSVVIIKGEIDFVDYSVDGNGGVVSNCLGEDSVTVLEDGDLAILGGVYNSRMAAADGGMIWIHAGYSKQLPPLCLETWDDEAHEGTSAMIELPKAMASFVFIGTDFENTLANPEEYFETEDYESPVAYMRYTLAGYKAATYSSITYTNLMGATHKNPGSYKEGRTLTFAAPSTLANYEFVGWEPAKIVATTQGNQVVKAVWREKKSIGWGGKDYTIFLHPGEAEGAIKTLVGGANRVYNLPANTFAAPKGKRFVGWKGSNGRRYDDKMLVINPVPAGEVLTLTAIWE